MNEDCSPCGHGLSLSKEQLAVLERYQDGVPLLMVIAKAGTGKTRTAAALACLVLGMGRSVLLLSFTKNGVKELAGELARHHGLGLERVTESHWQGQGIVLRTFDSILAWSLREIGVKAARWERAGLRWQVQELEHIGGTALRHEGQEAGLWTARNYDHQLREVCDLIARHQPLSEQAKAVLDRPWRVLRDRAMHEGLILPADYDRLVISHAGTIAGLLGEQFDVVIVDEHQDSSERDVAPLIEARRANRLVQVNFGDPGQSVLGFRGALGDLDDAFFAAGCAPEVLALTENRRSSPEIVSASNALQRAAGWQGPLAVPHPATPRGPKALLAIVDEESVALDALMVVLVSCGLAPDRAAKSRVPGDLAAALEERGEQMRRLCAQRTPLVEVISPTNKIAEDLVTALEERGVEPAWVRSVANPYDALVATLLDSWFDVTGDAVEQARMVLTAHANAWAAGTEIAVREELRACADVVLHGLETLRRTADRSEIAENISAIMRQVAAHQNVSEEGRRYVEKAVLLVEGFSTVPYARSVAEAVAALEETLVVRHRPTNYRRRSQPRPSLLQALKSGVLCPAEVPAWLDDQAHRWRLARSDEPTSGLVIKTAEIAKGDTCDGVIVYHAECLPRRERRCVLAADNQDELARPAQAYIAVSRPRFVYVGLAVGKLPLYHDVALECWTYLDACSEGARTRWLTSIFSST